MIFFTLALIVAISTISIVFVSRYVPIYILIPFLTLCSYIGSNIAINQFGYAISREYIARGTKGIVLWGNGDYVLFVENGKTEPRLVKFSKKEGDEANKEMDKNRNVQKSIQFGEEDLSEMFGFGNVDDQQNSQKNKLKIKDIDGDFLKKNSEQPITKSLN